MEFVISDYYMFPEGSLWEKNNPDKMRVHRGLPCSISPVVG